MGSRRRKRFGGLGGGRIRFSPRQDDRFGGTTAGGGGFIGAGQAGFGVGIGVVRGGGHVGAERRHDALSRGCDVGLLPAGARGAGAAKIGNRP